MMTFALALAFALPVPHAGACQVAVIDGESGWPVPLVELRTTHNLRFVSDNAGLIALDAPELFDRSTWFTVIGHGYGVAPDGFGMRGVRLTTVRGGRLVVKVTRTSIGRRLGRVTGAGLFAESQKLGLPSPLTETGVFGCDSTQTAIYQGRLWWTWGDTTLPGYPLGIFDGTAATTATQPLTRFEPPLALKLDYVRDNKDQPCAVAKLPGTGPSWITGIVTLRDRAGLEHLVTGVTKIKPPLTAYRFDLAEWHDGKREFLPVKTIWEQSAETPKTPSVPEGHTTTWTDPAGKKWLYFGNPFPTLRCPATYEAWLDPKTWEVLTSPHELRDATDKPVLPHSGSIVWNGYRKRYTAVFVEKFGKPSAFGEIWYAEAPTPIGPWGRAVKVLTHENYTFYNTKIHPSFTNDDSPIVIFEGTYTAEFADHAPPTPRYNYNQMMIRLDLDDERLRVAQVQAIGK